MDKTVTSLEETTTESTASCYSMDGEIQKSGSNARQTETADNSTEMNQKVCNDACDDKTVVFFESQPQTDVKNISADESSAKENDGKAGNLPLPVIDSNDDLPLAHLEGSEDSEKINIWCDPCSVDEATQVALAFCLDCLEYLCETCCRDHRRMKFTRQHKVLKDSDFPRNTEPHRFMKEMLNCPSHPDKTVSFKCQKHSSLICLLCLATEHKLCEEVVEIENLGLAQIDKEEMDLFRGKIKDLIKDVRSKVNQTISSICSEEALILKSIESAKDSLHQRIDCIAKDLKDSVCSLVHEERHRLENDLLHCKGFENETMKHKDLYETANAYGTTSEKYLVSEHVQREMTSLLGEIKAIDVKPIKLKCTQLIDPKTLNSLGSVQLIKVNSSTSIIGDEQTNASSDDILEKQQEESKLKENLEESRFSEETENNFSLPPRDSLITKALPVGTVRRIEIDSDRRDCVIRSILTLTDGRILLSDYSNVKLKMFDRHLSYITHKNLTDRPVDCCVVKREQTDSTYRQSRVAVCFNKHRGVAILLVSTTEFVYLKQISNERYIRSLTMIHDTLCLLCCKVPWEDLEESDALLQLCDMNGCLLREIEFPLTVSDPQKVRCIDNNLMIALGTQVIVYDTNKILSQSLLQQKWFYKGPKDSVDGIRDVDFDDEGNMYVACLNSENVHQVSMKNYWKNRILLTGVEARAVHYDTGMKRLFVFTEHGDNIHVFDF